MAPYDDTGHLHPGPAWVAPYIYDGNGDLIWSGVSLFERFKIWDFRVAKFNGTDMLTGISHVDDGGKIINNEYELARTLRWTPSWNLTNRHEFNVIENGSRALALTKEEFKKLSAAESKIAGHDGECKVNAQGLIELDITVDPPKTLFEWKAIDHIGLNETTFETANCTNNWDIQYVLFQLYQEDSSWR